MKALLLAAALTFPALARYVDVPVTVPTLARASGGQRQPRVATDGRDFFAVWIDARGGYGSLYGTRLLADGTVLDPAGILLTAPDQYCDSVALAFDGANYVVTYQSSSRVSFVRIARDGSILGAPQTIFDHNGAAPSIASNGHGSIVIAHSLASTNNGLSPQYQVASISQSGAVIQKNPLAETLTNEQIASNGEGYLIAWAGSSTTEIIRLDNNGDAISGSFQILAEAFTRLAAVPGGKYLLAGTKYTSGSYCAQRIIGRIVSSSSISDSFVIHDAGGADIQDIALTSDATGFQLAWMKRLGTRECPYPLVDPGPPPSPPFGLQQIHINADGSVGAPSAVIENSGSDEQPAIVSNGSAEALVWIEFNETRIAPKVAAAITHQGAQAAIVNIASSAPAQSNPTVTSGDGILMTVWIEESNGSSAVYARRFNTDGVALDANAAKVSTNGQARMLYPSAAFDGAVWLFLWTEDFKVVARRMAIDGTWIDTVPLTIGNHAGLMDYAVTTNGKGFAVLTVTSKPALTLIPRAGGPLQLTVPLVLGFSDYLITPSLAWDGKEFVAVWNRGNTNDIEGIGINEAGTVTLPRFAIANTSQPERTPSIACHEDSCVIAWSSNGSIAATRLINGTLVPFNAAPYNAIENPALGNFAVNPIVLTTPSAFQLLWIEQSNTTPTLYSATITSAIDPRINLGTIAITGATITPRNQLALTLARPSADPSTGGVIRAYLRVWPAEGKRRAVGR